MDQESKTLRNSQTDNVLKDGHYWVRISSLHPSIVFILRTTLYALPTTVEYISSNLKPGFQVYLTHDDWIGVPPFFPLYCPESLEKIFVDARQIAEHSGLPRDIQFGGDFKGWRTDYKQEDVANNMLQVILRDGGGQLCLDTGMGKTLISLWLISRLKRKTLVIVHKRDSIIQWKQQAERFLPGVKVGVMRAQIRDYQDKDIVLTTVQSLSKGKYSKAILDEFGFTIADEIHLMASRIFHLAFPQINSQYRLGLTATPKRKDNLNIVIDYYFGRPAVILVQPRNDIIVRVVHYKAGDQTVLWLGNPANRKENYVKMLSRLVTDRWRNFIVVKECKEQCSIISKGGQILLVSDRKNHCYMLEEMLKAENLTKSINLDTHRKIVQQAVRHPASPLFGWDTHLEKKLCSLLVRKEPITISAITGDHNDDERQIRKKSDIIIATLKLVKESLDLPCLARLIITTPVSKLIIQQLRGRILRLTEREAKERNLTLKLLHIFDEWEDSGMFTGMYWGCNAYYKNQDYKFEHVTYDEELLEQLCPSITI